MSTRKTRNKNTTAEDESSASTNTELLQTIQAEDTPVWGKSLYELLNNAIKALDVKVSNYDHDIQLSIKTATDLAGKALTLAESRQATVDSLELKVDQHESTINHLSEAVVFLLAENKKRDNHILQNECYSRRENLLFRGYTTRNNDTESCEDKVRHIMTMMGVRNVQNIKMVRCHYLNEQKQIIARFQSYTDRERVWASRYKLKNTNIFVAEDFPSAIVSRRKQLYPVCKAAKSIPAYHKKVTMRGDKLILDGKDYTCSDLHRVPRDVHPAKLAERSDASTLVFGGSTSGHHKLSNFYKIRNNFVYEHISYSSAEQAFQHKKARVAGDQNKEREILFNTDPSIQKSLGNRVKGLDDTAWSGQKRDIMKDILIAKFTQHEDLRNYLLSTKDKKIAEANAKDSFFAIGLPLTHQDVLKSDKWPENGNKLGDILMEIRQELRSEG